MLEKQSTYIYSIEGKDLYKRTMEIKKGRKFKAALDYSLEAIQIEKIAQSVYKNKKEKANIFYQEEEKQYTNRVVNVTFKYNVKEYNLITIKDKEYYVHLDSDLDNKLIKDIIFIDGVYIKDNLIQSVEIGAHTTLKSKQLPKGFGVKEDKIYLTTTGTTIISTAGETRKELYKEGFNIKYSEKEIIEYVRFKRSSGSSRVGKCLFIEKKLYGDMLEWSMMGLNFDVDNEIDLAALEAYISLTTSSIIDTMEIQPKNILIIDDYESIFPDTAMVTEVIKESYINDKGEKDSRDRLSTEPKKTIITNSIWDGESLIDLSLIPKDYKDKGMLLLRNRFLKSCCFNCNIQDFFKDNGITSVNQLNGKTLAKDIKDVLFITTPSSIKYLKFGTWDAYTNKLSSTFGIVKYEKPTHYFKGRMVQTHYQLLNTLQLSEKDMKVFLKDSLDYVKLLKTDIRVFREHLHIKIKDNIEYGSMSSTDEFIMTMLQLNNKFENTDLFNNFRQDSIKSYIKNMKKGHILIHGTYSVLCGNGLEMLKSSCKDINNNGESLFKGDSLLNGDEVFCSNFPYKKPLIGSRSPHVTIGNIWLSTNTNKEKADKILEYFNSSKQIIHINSVQINTLERLSSADFDSDSLLLSDNKLLISRARLNYDKYLVPTSKVEAKKVKRLNTPEEKCDLDIKTSKNLIGEIINCSQILNSKLWDSINSKKLVTPTKWQEDLYATISQLDVMSCIEIDKAKKEFSIDNKLELEDIRKKYVYGKKKPAFFKFLSKGKKNKVKAINYDKHRTSMDYLINIINVEIRKITQAYRRGDNPVVTFGELFSKEVNIKLSGANSKQADNIVEKCKLLKDGINSIWINENTSPEEKYKEVIALRKKHITSMKRLKVTSETIKKVIYNLDQKSVKLNNGILVKTELDKNSRNVLNTLYQTQKDKFIPLFEESKDKIEIIKEIYGKTEGKEVINIYNIHYIVKNG
ncbi:hypothetical protein [Clostridium sp.]|uniref:hypothetical protein n=1 Tax=Clostridium sp. TaxID=1506 RepID=UPI001A4B97BC|nr:hypothetical protein [Clostridium sp.]MBK5239797.1 hypothetical protein [Clostridium sp.]